MASKVIAQLIVNGVTILSRAFITAYQQALRNAKAGGAAGAAAAPVTRHRISTMEALNILNIEKAELTPKLVEERYAKMFQSNDPAKGGSFYLQSKIHRSKEALLSELKDISEGKKDGEIPVDDAAAQKSDQTKK